MGNTTIQTQSFRAVDAEQSKSKRYIIPFALLCSLFFLWAVANNLNDILLPQFQQGKVRISRSFLPKLTR